MAGNLACSLAQAGRRVVLVDGDLRRPRLHELLDLPDFVGLADYLRRSMDVSEVIHPSAAEGLDLVPAGKAGADNAEMLASASPERMIQALGRRYEAVVIDSPAFAAVTDAALLGA